MHRDLLYPVSHHLFLSFVSVTNKFQLPLSGPLQIVFRVIFCNVPCHPLKTSLLSDTLPPKRCSEFIGLISFFLLPLPTLPSHFCSPISPALTPSQEPGLSCSIVRNKKTNMEEQTFSLQLGLGAVFVPRSFHHTEFGNICGLNLHVYIINILCADATNLVNSNPTNRIFPLCPLSLISPFYNCENLNFHIISIFTYFLHSWIHRKITRPLRSSLTFVTPLL